MCVQAESVDITAPVEASCGPHLRASDHDHIYGTDMVITAVALLPPTPNQQLHQNDTFQTRPAINHHRSQFAKTNKSRRRSSHLASLKHTTYGLLHRYGKVPPCALGRSRACSNPRVCACFAFLIKHVYAHSSTYDHRSVRTGHPVRSAIHKH
jgi:hypothetical protein